MAFCINCGQEFADGAKFCANCGKTTDNNTSSSQRKTVYDGEIHKCPNCGEALNSFSTHCSSCGYEIRDAHSSNAIRELVQKLEQIDTECMAPIERLKDAFGVVVTGVDISSIESDKSSNG